MRLPFIPESLRRTVRRLAYCSGGSCVVYLIAGHLTLHISGGPVVAVAASGITGSGDAHPDESDTRRAVGETPVTVVRGVLSVHSGRSHDAEGTLDEVAGAAARTGLDFVVTGDHPGDWMEEVADPLSPRVDQGVLLVPGLELVVSGVGRTLAVGLDTLPRRWESGVEELAARAAASDAFLSIVHPRSPRSRERWDGLAVDGIDAWESFDVSEMARLRLKDAWAGYHIASFLGGLAIGRGHAGLEGLWREGTATPALLSFDSARARVPLTLTGGLNHHPKTRVFGNPFPGYESFFQTIVNHVFLDGPLSADPFEARGQLLDGLRRGRLFVTLGGGEGAAGFEFGARSSEGWASMGERIALGSGATLEMTMPERGPQRLFVRILLDGREIGWRSGSRGERLHWAVDRPGVYRVEVFRGGIGIGGMRYGFRPWIIANPVEIRAAPDGERDLG